MKKLFYRILTKVRQLLSHMQVWCQSKLFPPPPKGEFPPIWMVSNTHHYGLLAKGGTVTPESLMLAYHKGIFPFCEEGEPVSWYCCNPRMVLFFENMKLTRGVRPLVKSGRYKVTFDTAFEDVVHACSDRERTWLFPERKEVAFALYQQGYSHSIEVWNEEGCLVGGFFGTDMGSSFIVESCFTRESNTVKVALAYLNCHLQHWGYRMCDCGAAQQMFKWLGYEDIPRSEYLELLKECTVAERREGPWSVDERLNVGEWNPKEPGSQVIS